MLAAHRQPPQLWAAPWGQRLQGRRADQQLGRPPQLHWRALLPGPLVPPVLKVCRSNINCYCA